VEKVSGGRSTWPTGHHLVPNRLLQVGGAPPWPYKYHPMVEMRGHTHTHTHHILEIPLVLLQCRNKGFDNFETLDKASRDLYEECKGCHKEHTVLCMILKLLKLKVSNGWSDSSFSTLLELLSKVLPKPNSLPISTYLAKKIIYPLTLGVEKIHACLNHCILYRKEYEFKDKCPRCNANQYKWNDNSEEDYYNNKRKGRKRKNTGPPDQDS
jgi:hypothetical protein